MGELRALQRGGIDLDNGFVTFWGGDRGTKNGDARAIPLHAKSREAAKRLLNASEGRPRSALLFSDVTRRSINRVWDKVKDRMGYEEDKHFIPHALRHLFASRLAQKAVEVQQIQRLMGHKTLSMTQRYSHLAPRNLFDAVSKLE